MRVFSTYTIYITGEFEYGKMQGKGVLLLTNGEKYEGEFFDGMVHGRGVFTNIDGDEIHGLW
jgi:hypothetical protein